MSIKAQGEVYNFSFWLPDRLINQVNTALTFLRYNLKQQKMNQNRFDNRLLVKVNYQSKCQTLSGFPAFLSLYHCKVNIFVFRIVNKNKTFEGVALSSQNL